MNGFRAIVAILLAGAASLALADSVRITFRPGMPTAGLSTESAEVYVSRDSKGIYGEAQIDRYFAAIETELKTIGPDKFCTDFAPDAATVLVHIQLGNLNRTLECDLSTGSTATDSASRERAFNRILNMTLDQARITLRK